MRKLMNDFNEFRFRGLNAMQDSNKYITMERINDKEDKIVVKVGDNNLIKTAYGYALVLNKKYVVFLKDWQVSQNYYGNEVLLTKKYWNIKEWGNHELFSESEEELSFENWVNIAKEQLNNKVKWEA